MVLDHGSVWGSTGDHDQGDFSMVHGRYSLWTSLLGYLVGYTWWYSLWDIIGDIKKFAGIEFDN